MKTKKIYIIFILFFYYILQGSSLSQSFRIFPSDTIQYEPIIVVSPLNPFIMFCSCNVSFTSGFNTGAFVTTNGGLNWFGSCSVPGNNNWGIPERLLIKMGFLF